MDQYIVMVKVKKMVVNLDQRIVIVMVDLIDEDRLEIYELLEDLSQDDPSIMDNF